MPSFVPGNAQLQLRELVRLRKQLVNEHSRQTNRIVRDLESQGIKLSSVLSDVLGKSGYAMVKALLAGDMSPEQIPLRRSPVEAIQGRRARGAEASECERAR